MRLGKISENIYNRSVKKLLPKKGSDVVVRSDSLSPAMIDISGHTMLFATTAQFVGNPECSIKYALAESFNKLLAKNAKPAFICLVITMPEKMREVNLKTIMAYAKGECEELSVDIMDVNVQVSSSVNEVVLTVNAFGYAKEPDESQIDYSGLEVVMAGFAGAAGSAIVAAQREEELRKRFPESFVASSIGLEDYRYIQNEAASAGWSDIIAAYSAGWGGIFAALWEFAEQLGIGLEIEIRKILFKQETIEICELYGLNPYELYSTGTMLMVTENAERLCSHLTDSGISATIIGRTTDGNDRVLINGEETRFLEPAKSDSLFEIISEGRK